MLTGEQRPGPATYVKATALSLARRYLGMAEVDGPASNPFIAAMLMVARHKGGMNPYGLPLGGRPDEDDATPWCGAFVHFIAWQLELERPANPLRARAWLTVGLPITLDEVRPGFDIAILTRGEGDQAGPEVLDAPGHVGLVDRIKYSAPGVALPQAYPYILGGNQGDTVSVRDFPVSRVLGFRRLRGAA